LFLDEIGEMPLELQPKLLRVLQERKLTRIGGKQEVHIDVRVVAATNVNLRQQIERGGFREDLYYRLSTFALRLPSLAERPMDIKPLALLFMQKHANGNELPELGSAALDVLLRHTWPGNVRELENVIARAMLLCEGKMIRVEDLMFDEYLDQNTESTCTPEIHATLHQSTALNEYQKIITVMRDANCRSKAAEVLGISERTLRHKLQRMREQGMDVPRVYSR
jgi:two-component system response regulator FlrC